MGVTPVVTNQPDMFTRKALKAFDERTRNCNTREKHLAKAVSPLDRIGAESDIIAVLATRIMIIVFEPSLPSRVVSPRSAGRNKSSLRISAGKTLPYSENRQH